MGKNKPTNLMSCRKLSRMINSVLEKMKQVTITYKTVNNILEKHYGKPKKIRKAFLFIGVV